MGNSGDGGQNMEREAKVGFGVPKSPDQLKNQVRQSNAFRIIKGEAEPLAPPNESGLQAPPLGHSDYPSYVSSLRGLRKFQHGQFEEQQSVSPESTQTEPRYYELNYDPNLARAVLDHLHGERKSSVQYVNPDKLAEISKSEAAFMDFLGDVASYPHALDENFPLIKNVLPAETLSQAFRKIFADMKSGWDLGDFKKVGFEEILDYVPREDIRRTFQEIATGKRNTSDTRGRSQEENSSFLDGIAKAQDLESLFTQEELRNLARIFIENNTNIYIGDADKNVPILLGRGILDQELLEKIVFQSIRGVTHISTAFQLLKYAPGITHDQLHDAFKQAFMESTEPQHIYNLPAAKAYLSETELFEALKRRVGMNPNISQLYGDYHQELESLFSESQWYEFIHRVVNHPKLEWFDEARKLITYSTKITPEQRWDLFQQLVANIDSQLQRGEITPDISPEEVLSYLEADLKNSSKPKPREKIESREIQDLFDELYGSMSLYDKIPNILQSFPEQHRGEVASIMLKVARDDSSRFREVLEHTLRFRVLSGEQVTQVIEDLITGGSSHKINEVLFDIPLWATQIEDDRLMQILDRIVTERPEIVGDSYRLYQIFKDLEGRFSTDQLRPVLEKIAFENPFGLFEIFNELEDKPFADIQTRKSVLTIGFSNEQKIAFVPKTLRELFHRLLATQNEKIVAGFIQEGRQLYEQIEVIREAGFEGIVKTILSRENLSPKQEQELLSMFSGYARIKRRRPNIFNELGLDLEQINFEEARTLLFRVIDKMLGREQGITSEQIRIFTEIMGSPAPFCIYLAKFSDNHEGYVELLNDIYESIIQGRFSEWKFGRSEEQFEQLKADRLLPDKLTFSQYGTWQVDEQTTLYDTLAVNSEDVVRFINQYLRDNVEHLNISHVINSAILRGEISSYDDLFQSVSERIRGVGQDLHGVNEQLNLARKSGNSDLVSRYGNIKEEKEKERKDLIRARSILRLMTLSNQEILQGVFLEGKDKNQPGEPLLRLLEQLKHEATPDDQFVYDEIKKLLEQVHASEDRGQNLYCTDSSNPKVMFEIGETPVSSCQHYDHGSENSCLLGYSDPNTKILIVRNERGNIIARSIFRLLTRSDDGLPVFHVERIYSSVASSSIPRIIYTHALKKAEEMGISAVVSKKAQTETGGAEEALPAPGFSLIRVPYTLTSSNLRAPSVYVDSAGGRNNGKYELTNLLEIRKTA